MALAQGLAQACGLLAMGLSLTSLTQPGKGCHCAGEVVGRGGRASFWAHLDSALLSPEQNLAATGPDLQRDTQEQKICGVHGGLEIHLI